jgi:glycosyltransferase involved in cell wall biosynthesis
MNNILKKYASAYWNKVTNRLFGMVSIPAKGKKKGNVLLSYITDPFTFAPGEHYTDPHSNPWVVMEMARLFTERGYAVDVINWNDNKFVPRKRYAVYVDIHNNFERLSPSLPEGCIKIMHITGSYPEFQNKAESERINALEKRRGVLLPMRREVPLFKELNDIDFIEGYGNKTVFGTYPNIGDKIIPIPVPTMETYDFRENKDFAAARKHFLWFGGGGAILKGLDLVVEAFAELPHLQLSIIGPAAYEKEFEKIYAKELALPNITRYGRPRINREGENLVDGRDIREIYDRCGAIIFLSASEGGGGATVQAMQTGLFPIVTPNTGIDEWAPSVVVNDISIENIKKVVEDFSNLPPEKVAQLARDSWMFAREHHTKEAFTKAYEDFLDNIVKLP